MDAVIMAGGLGTRLGMGEKPCIDLLGKPLVSYMIDALEKAEHIGRIFVAVSPATQKTGRVVSGMYGENVRVIMTPGGNYVGDMIYTVENAGIKEPVLVTMSDLPLITPELIDSIVEEYGKAKKPAMSVYVPISVCKELGIRPDTVFHKDGKIIVPTGVNVLDGKHIHEEQEDYNLILEEPELALNINTVEDLKRCKEMLKRS